MSNEQKSNSGQGGVEQTDKITKPKRNRANKKGRQKTRAKNLPDKAPVKGSEVVLQDGQYVNVSPEQPVPENHQVQHPDTPKSQHGPIVPELEAPKEIDYSNTTQQPDKISHTIPPAGREQKNDPYRGEPIVRQKNGSAGVEEIVITNGKHTQRVSKLTWKRMQEGAAGDWKEAEPETPDEVKHLKKHKK